ncbi:MAG: amidohydrolase family protein [Saprospiraceae bacterium]|nr:amidohydrolase family protein [Saprospiraceae bacterium]
MECIFRNVEIIDPNSKHHLQKRDVWVKNGEIQEIKSKINSTKKIKEFAFDKSCLSPGWVDIGCTNGEPGYEHRETLQSLASSAAAGGYTTICCFPNTKPTIHSKSEVTFIKNRSQNLPVTILPIGAISKDCASEEMAEILQMFEAGAIAFSDGRIPIQKSGLLMRALEYLKLIPSTLLINTCVDKGIAGAGQMHEGKTSTSLGLKGIPALAETINIQRDLAILKYTQSRMLIHKVSSAESVLIIKTEKSKLANLFSSVSIFNLIFEDDQLENFNVHLKLDPPIRSKTDRKALIQAVKDGTIDIICSDHTPWDAEKKDLEFQTSAFGSISLETAFAAFCTYLAEDLSVEKWIEQVAINPRKILNLQAQTIQVGSNVDLSYFNPTMEWLYEKDRILSISKNSPFIGNKLKGKVLGTWTKGAYNDFSET